MIEIDYPNEAKIYCPACGTLILSSGESGDEFVMNECLHLVWLGTDEGPEFDRNKLSAQFEEWRGTGEDLDAKDNTHFLEYFRKHLDDYYVCFTQRTPPPGMLSGFTIFHFPLD